MPLRTNCFGFLRTRPIHWSGGKIFSSWFSKTWFESENVARIFHKTNRVIFASVSLTIRLQSSRFSKIHQFVPLIIFYSEPIFHVIRVSNSHVCQKTVPAIFEKKRLSLSLLWLSELSLKVENGHAVQHLAPPVLRRAGAPGLNSSFNF